MVRVCVIVAVVALLVRSSLAEISTTQPFPGILLETEVRNSPPMRLFVVTVNLTDPHVHLKVSRGGNDQKLAHPWEGTLMRVSEMADRDGLTIAINGNMFQAREMARVLGWEVPYLPGNSWRACGWGMSDGKVFSDWPADRDWPSLVVDDRGGVSIGRMDRVPPNARQIVSGIEQIVTAGKISTNVDDSPAPHTAVGIDREGKKLIMLVVDGRRPEYSVGMSWRTMAREMQKHGAWDALLLDGGGSSTLVMRTKDGKAAVVNEPSDGHDLPVAVSVERCVANALGVVIEGSATHASTP